MFNAITFIFGDELFLVKPGRAGKTYLTSLAALVAMIEGYEFLMLLLVYNNILKKSNNYGFKPIYFLVRA